MTSSLLYVLGYKLIPRSTVARTLRPNKTPRLIYVEFERFLSKRGIFGLLDAVQFRTNKISYDFKEKEFNNLQ